MSTPTPTLTSPPTPAEDIFVCTKWEHGSCRKEKFYDEHDGKPYCVLHYPGAEKTEDFEEALSKKLEDGDFNFEAVWFPDTVSFHNFTFGAPAYFNYAHFNAAADFSGARFTAIAEFRVVQFSAAAYFTQTQFTGAANFSYTSFKGEALFIDAQFGQYADFYGVEFVEDVSFISVQFGGPAYFSAIKFTTNVGFNHAVFSAPAYFQRIAFIPRKTSLDNKTINTDGVVNADDVGAAKPAAVTVDFNGAKFSDGVRFEENMLAGQVFMSFAVATFEKPERAVFQTTPLCPHWFINVDPRKFTFVNANWGKQGNRAAIRRELAALEELEVSNPGSLLEVAYRQLAVNAEENNLYEEAAKFRYMAMDVKQLQAHDEWLTLWRNITPLSLRWWYRLLRRIRPFNLRWWYWLLSGYGERVWQAFVALIVIWLLFAVVYWSGDATWWQPKQSAKVATESGEAGRQSAGGVDASQASARAPLTFGEALIYSAGVMTLQKPEPSPANKRAKAAVLFETILGPLQAALLALAIRRKFMR
jgi:hypothetical protein